MVLDQIERGQVSHATRLLDQAEAAFRAVDDRRGEAIVWWLRSAVGLHAGEVAPAVEAGKRSLERFQTLGDAWGMASVLGILAELAQRRGDYREAVAMCEQSLALARSSGLAYAEQDELVRLGTLLLLLGDQERAQARFEESLALASRIGYRVGAVLAYNGLGMLARRRGDLQLATRHHQQAVATLGEASGRAGVGGLAGMAQSLCCLGWCSQLSGRLEEAERFHRQALLAAREHGAPLPIALCLEGLAGVAAAAGDAEQAARLLGVAAGIRERIGVPLLDAEHADVEQAAATARDALGRESFTRAHRQGQMLDLDRVLNHPVV